MSWDELGRIYVMRGAGIPLWHTARRASRPSSLAVGNQGSGAHRTPDSCGWRAVGSSSSLQRKRRGCTFRRGEYGPRGAKGRRVKTLRGRVGGGGLCEPEWFLSADRQREGGRERKTDREREVPGARCQVRPGLGVEASVLVGWCAATARLVMKCAETVVQCFLSPRPRSHGRTALK